MSSLPPFQIFVKVRGCFYGHLHTIFHILDCNNSMPIAIKCEDNYNIRAAAIHYFYSLQQITSRKKKSLYCPNNAHNVKNVVIKTY